MFTFGLSPDVFSEDLPVKRLEWTTTPPTEPGWYWMCANRTHGQFIYLDYVDWHDGQLCTEEYSQYLEGEEYTPVTEDKDITHWLGPLPVPEPPK